MVEYRLRLSTVLKADSDVEKQRQLCRRIQAKLRRSGSRTVKPILIIDVVPSKDEQRIAGAFLDYFNIPSIRVLEPEFVFKKGIRADQLTVFFEAYRQTLSWYRKIAKI